MAREQTVKAFVFTANGGPEVEKFADLPRPVPGRGQLLVAVRAAGVNPADWKRRVGFRRPGMPDPQFPTVFGTEAAGVVEAAGDGADGFAPLEELAGLLGGVVGVSRVVTSEGWRPHSMQVGQTGTKITPDLYLACGISGAIQHFAGCSGAKYIIAINTDPSAPMMTRADYAVVGDLHAVLPALIGALRARVAGRESALAR